MKENAHDMFFGSWYNLEDGSGVYAIVNSLDNKKIYRIYWNIKKKIQATLFCFNKRRTC